MDKVRVDATPDLVDGDRDTLSPVVSDSHLRDVVEVILADVCDLAMCHLGSLCSSLPVG